MAYGCQASLDHALPRIEGANEKLIQLAKDDAERGATTAERKIIAELALAVAYLCDAVRYLKDGVK